MQSTNPDRESRVGLGLTPSMYRAPNALAPSVYIFGYKRVTFLEIELYSVLLIHICLAKTQIRYHRPPSQTRFLYNKVPGHLSVPDSGDQTTV